MNTQKQIFRNWSLKMRTLHRYTGFFMIGIMSVYAFTGIILLFRSDFAFKYSTPKSVVLEPGLSRIELIDEVSERKDLNLRRFDISETQGDVMYFPKNRYNTEGSYNTKTGRLEYTQKDYPKLIEKLVAIHKAEVGKSFGAMAIVFGITLFFFIFSSLFMFNPRTPIFKKGMLYMLGGMIFTIIFILMF